MARSLFSWIKRYRIHLLIWLLYIGYETVLVGIFVGGVFGDPRIYLCHYAIIICLFYLHALKLMPWAVANRKDVFWKLPMVIIIQMCVYVVSHNLLDHLLSQFITYTSRVQSVFELSLITRNVYRGLYFIGLSTGYYFLRTFIAERKRVEDLERSRLEDIIKQQDIERQLVVSQNAFLKAQINPHFLFNTLDFVYHHVNKHSEEAGEAIIRLSQMMRFAIDSEHLGETILFAAEIEQVENLIYLQQMRKKSPLGLEFIYDDAVCELKIIPLVLLTLVENIFKHGKLDQNEFSAFIEVGITNEKLFILTDNVINDQKPTFSNHSGMDNIQKRLLYAYGEQVSFNYKADERGHFIVEILVPLSCLSSPIHAANPSPGIDR